MFVIVLDAYLYIGNSTIVCSFIAFFAYIHLYIINAFIRAILLLIHIITSSIRLFNQVLLLVSDTIYGFLQQVISTISDTFSLQQEQTFSR